MAINKTNFFRLIVATAVVAILVLVCMSIQVVLGVDEAAVGANRDTEEFEKTLTEMHGEQVRHEIEYFLVVSGSYEAYKNRQILTEIVTGPYLELLTLSGEQVSNESSWLVTDSVTLEGIRVIEYASLEFKAIGCGNIQTNRVTPENIILSSLPPHEFRNVFVFVQVEGEWKLEAHYSVMDSEDAVAEWEYAPNWLKESIGDITNYIHKDCI